MTRSLVPQVVRDRLPTLPQGGLLVATDGVGAWLAIRSDAPEYFGAQPIDLRSDLACYDAGAVLELQLWLAGALVQPVVYQTWLDPLNPDDRQAVAVLSACETTEVLFFEGQNNTLRFGKAYRLNDGIRERLTALMTEGRDFSEQLANPFWLAAKSAHLRRG
ncbi:MAG: hypothetical protein JNL73_17620 [Anaerolineales bacterium]|nr:hypothetical protein [Anaerolineales bacterium]